MVPNKGASEDFVKAVVDSMSGCGCGRAILKSDGELAIVALQEAVENSRQSDTIRGRETVSQTEQQRMQ